MKQTAVYRVDCQASGKSYIGITCRPLRRRWQDHVRNSKKEGAIGLAGAIRKHGAGAFTVACIASFSTRNEAEDAERSAIVKYGTMAPGGYNITHGGDGGATRTGSVHSEETKQKMSLAALGVPKSPEHRSSMSRATAGRVLSPDHAAKIRLLGIANRGKRRTEEQKIKGRLSRRIEAVSGRAGASGIVGVTPAPGGRWYARIKCDGTRKRLGCFSSKEEAAEAYNAAAAEHLLDLQYALPSGNGDASQPFHR